MASGNRTVLTQKKETQGFNRIKEPLELRQLISRAIGNHVQADVQLARQAVRFQGAILESSHPEKALHFEAPADLSDEELVSPTGEVMIIAFLRGQMLLCIRAENAIWKDRILTVEPPWSIFKLQRRKEPRFEIPKGYEISATLESFDDRKRRITKRVLDISEHGVGIEVATKDEAIPFKPGRFLRRLCIVLEGRQIYFDARVANVLPISGRVAIKVGLEVMRMSPVDGHFIASYVARNLIQFYS